jgi:hypothetical protein
MSLFARGKTQSGTETESGSPHNAEWVLCITGFDVSELSPSLRVIGDILTRNLVVSLSNMNRHIRVSGEYTYYYQYTRTTSLTAAGKSLEAKRAERDQLLFKGGSDWQYRNQLKTLDSEIKALEEKYSKTETDPLNIADDPAFKLTEENKNGTFPAPPQAGGEYFFCRTQNVDAYVEGKFSEFHGRVYLNIKLYTLHTRSFVYEDELLFSTEDTNQAVEELSGRLVAAVSGAPPAAISVKADNEDAVILLKNSFAGRGETGVLEYPPETVDVTVFAGAHRPETAQVELQSGELTELEFNLYPLPQAPFDIDVDAAGSSVYQGALYVGESPLTLGAPLNNYEYFHAETPRGAAGAVIFRAGQLENPVYIQTRPVPGPDAKPLGKARRQYYGAWLRFWIALPLAVLMNGLTGSYQDAYQLYGNSVFQDNYRIYNGIRIGIWVAFGAVAVDSLIRIFRYTYTASRSIPRELK